MADFETDVEFEMDLDVDVEFDIEPEIIPNAMDVFYEKAFWFSYSSIKMLLYNPPSFMEKYINKVYEERLDKHLIDGKLIHCLILQPDEFRDQFIISPLTIPTGKNREIVHSVFKHHRSIGGADTATLQDYSSLILTELQRVNLHQALVDDKKAPIVTGNQKRLAKMLTDENKSYFDYQLTRGNKNVIDQKQLDFCTAAAQIILKNEELCKLMGIGLNSPEHEVINEKMLYMDLKDYKFGLKGIIDNLHIDHTAKKIYVNDFKTTNKELIEFPEAVIYWCYHYQAVIYLQLIGFHYKDLIYNQGYTVEFRFIAIDKNMQAYPFLVSEGTLMDWLDIFKDKLEEANYHFTQKEYKLPYSFAKNLVTI